MSVNSQQTPTKQTPTAVHTRNHLLGNETIQQSPLGMLAALASPSPRVPVKKQTEVSLSESPPTSPSVMAATRHQQKEQQMEDMEINAAARQLVRSSNQSANITPTRSPAVGTDDSKLPSVSQLDVLALVTATSPPMRDNQQWTTATTPKPMNAGSDTESETEEQLRSYSARMRSCRRTPQGIRALRDRSAGYALAGRNGSSESTETDDDQRIRPLFAHRRPAGDRGGAHSFYPKRTPAPPAGPLFYPSSAPSLNRRQPRRYIRGTGGAALSNQLSQLVEENDDDSDKSSESSLSLSLSPPPYTSQQRIESKKRKLKQSGSDETTETESAHSGSQRRRRKLRSNAADQESDDGEKTETDDEFFGPSRLAIHGSIRPPRRVVRHLEGLQGRYPPPAALNFSRYQQQQQQQQQHQQPQSQTAPNSSGPNNAGFGLGINGGDGSNGMTGGARILSTPSSMARAGMVSAVRRERPPLPPPGSAVRTRENRTNSLYNSSMGREFGRDPFAPTAVPAPMAAPATITSREAAMRRLERPRQDSEKKRARALTAPSSLEPPIGKRPRTNRTSFEETSVDRSPPVSSLRSSLFASPAPADLTNSQEPSSSSTVTLGDQNSSESGKDNDGGILFPSI